MRFLFVLFVWTIMLASVHASTCWSSEKSCYQYAVNCKNDYKCTAVLNYQLRHSMTAGQNAEAETTTAIRHALKIMYL